METGKMEEKLIYHLFDNHLWINCVTLIYWVMCSKACVGSYLKWTINADFYIKYLSFYCYTMQLIDKTRTTTYYYSLMNNIHECLVPLLPSLHLFIRIHNIQNIDLIFLFLWLLSTNGPNTNFPTCLFNTFNVTIHNRIIQIGICWA